MDGLEHVTFMTADGVEAVVATLVERRIALNMTLPAPGVPLPPDAAERMPAVLDNGSRLYRAGAVVSVDLDPRHPTEQPGVEVHRHDLIDARLLLVHLPRRAEIVNMLVDALAPGGWLVIGDYGARRSYAVSGPAAPTRSRSGPRVSPTTNSRATAT